MPADDRAGPAARGRRRPRRLGQAHRSAASSATRASVPASRSLTSSATETASPCSRGERPVERAGSPGRRRAPGGTASGASGVPVEDASADEVVQARGAGQDDPGADDRPGPHQHALEQRAARAHERVVLDDDGPRAGRLEHAADGHAGRQVDPGADLGARPDEHVRVDHRVLADPRPDVHERRRHDHDARAEVRAGPHGWSRRGRSATAAASTRLGLRTVEQALAAARRGRGTGAPRRGPRRGRRGRGSGRGSPP